MTTLMRKMSRQEALETFDKLARFLEGYGEDELATKIKKATQALVSGIDNDKEDEP